MTNSDARVAEKVNRGDYDGETVEKPDKKAGLNRVPSKPKPETGVVAPREPAPAVTPATVADFVPVKRGDDDQPDDNEKWGDKDKRQKLEKETETIIVARMKPLEQLGLDAGRAAVQVKEYRQQLKLYERNVVTYTKRLADAEALLNARLDALRRAEL
jgi:hypothetical protein